MSPTTESGLKRQGSVAIFSLACLALAFAAIAQTFRINDVRVGPDGRIVLQHTADTNSYYILLRGDQVTAILTASDMQFGSIGTNQLTDPNIATNAGFYRIRQVPLASPLDTDGDGMDDVCEIKYRPLLDPLNPGDANLDPDSDGRTTLEECRDGRNPFVADIPEVTTISYPTNATTGSFVIFSGIASTNTLIRVEGGAAFVTNGVDAGGVFEVTVPLTPNRLNRLFVSAVDEFGNVSAPVPIDILQDSVAPYLFIDFPTNGTVLTASNTLVAGRVGDALSGFLGLSVTVDGGPANVDVGIGPNGTFQRMTSLNPGTNLLTVVASDRLGNSITKNVTVIREEPAGPRLIAVAGDLQQTNILRRLAEPLVVKATEPGGAPLANTLVSFQVTRSDGRLLPVNTNQVAVDFTKRADYSSNGAMFLQLFTDASGEARAWWTMGTDAGHANNRVTVSSAGMADIVLFCASATALPAKQINVGSGNNQRGEMLGHAPEPLKVWVSDGNNPVAGVPVTFRIGQGGGELVPIVEDDGKTSPAGPGLRGSRPTGSIALKRTRAKGGVQASEVTVLTSITGHAEVDWIFGDILPNQSVQADFAGNTGLPVTFNATALARVPGQPTTFVGLIQDNALQPIGRAFCELKVAGATLTAFSDVQGRFSFTDIPSGAGHLLVDGAAALTLGTNNIPSNTFPALQYTVAIVPNAENSLPTPVLLPRLNTNNAQWYYGTNDLVIACNGIAGLKMFIKANSMKHPDGQIVSPGRPALVSLNQVHHDDIPMPMPDGASPPFAWTLQPGGATFDPPVQVEYPNMSGLAPGAAAFFLTFNHDTERFEIVASGHVTPDGSKIVCDPGAGLTISGWGCNCPPYSVTGECDKCEGAPLPGLAKAAGDYQFTDKGIRANPNVPLDSSECGKTPTLFPDTPTVGTCECSAGPDGPRTKIRIQIHITVKDKWYNGNITNQADIAYITQHENHHVEIAKEFYDQAVDLAIRYNDRDYATEAACELNVQEFVKKYAELEKLHDAKQRAHDNDEERRKCNAILRRHGLPRSLLTGAPKDGSDDHADHFTKIIERDLWTLTINGQTRTVNGLNSFRIGNIAAPDLFGAGGPGSVPDFVSDDYVRLTGHSTTGGITRYVFSEPFRVRQGQSVPLTALTFTDFPPPSTESLRAVPDNPTLTVTGQMTQVRVTATLNDGSTLDVTPRERWTTYRSSNPGVLTVDPDGLGTARGKGMVFVTAVNEGATAVCQIDVSPGDPLTVVRGFLRDTNGAPFSGVTVNLVGLANEPLVTGADGSFVFTNVPTTFGALRVLARLVTPTNAFFATALLDPVAGGITDAGTLGLKPGVTWIGPVSGVWHGPTNWSNGQVPGPSSDVYISTPPGVTVTISQGAHVVNNLVLQSPLQITGGSLRVLGPIQAFSPIQLAGGQLLNSIVDSPGVGISGTSGTLNAMTLNCDFDLLNGTLNVVNGLVLNGIARVGHPSNAGVGTLNFNGSQTLSGSGSVRFGNAGCNVLRVPVAGSTLTNRILIHGQNGQIGWSFCAGGSVNSRIINEGVIAADVNAGTIIVRGAPVLNSGQLLAGAGTVQVIGLAGDLGNASVFTGGHLNLDGTYTNNLALPINGGRLTLNGNWFNGGALLMTNSTLALGGSFGLGDLGAISRSGGIVDVTGTLDGEGGTLELNAATGVWNVNGGTLRNMIVHTSDGIVLSGMNGTLDRVTIEGDLSLLNGTLNVTNGLVLNGLVRVGHPSNGQVGILIFNGSQALTGSGSVLLGSSGCNALRVPLTGTTLTNRVLIHGHSGQIGWSGCAGGAANSRIVNEGTLSAEVSGGTIVVRATPVLNHGQLLASAGTLQIIGLTGNLGNASVAAGAHLNLSGTYTNNLVLPVNGGTLTLDGDWFNAGELRLTNSTFNLDGTFGLQDLGTIVRVGGSVRVTGLLEGAGGTLALDDATGPWLMNGGTLRQVIVSANGSALLQGTSGTLDGVALDSNLDLLSGTLNVVNGLVLNGVARIGHPSSGQVGTLNFNGSQVVSGSGSILLGNSGCNALRIPVAGSTLTNRVLIHGHSGQIGWSACAGGAVSSRLVNENTISADVAAGTIVIRGAPVLNAGQLLASAGTLQVIGLAGNLGNAAVSAGAHLSLDGTYTNNLVLPNDGGTLTLNGDWFNAGELRLTNATFNLGGTFGLDDLGTIVRSGGSVRVTGLLEGAGGTLVLDDTTGSWLMNGGTLRQLTISASGSAVLQGTSGTLDGVTLNGNFDVLNGNLNLVNGLVLNGTARVGHPSNGQVGTLNFNGSQVVSGSGNILFGNSGCNALRIPAAGSTLTNRVLVHGHSGQIGWSACAGGAASSSIVNEGTLSADTSGGTIIVRGSPVLNAGQLLAGAGTLQIIGLSGNVGTASVSTGAHLDLDGAYTNDLALPVIGGRLTLRGNWFNGGELLVTNSTLALNGNFGLADLGAVHRSGGVVDVTGTFDGEGGTLELNATTGAWNVNGGTLRDLVVHTSDGVMLVGISGTLDGVTIEGDLNLPNGTLNVVNGLALNGLTRVGHPSNGQVGTLNFNGSQVVSGSGSILLGNSGCNALRIPVAGSTLTNRVLIHGHSGQIGWSACAGGAVSSRLVNENTISADVAAGTIVIRGTPVLNDGQLSAGPGTLQIIGLAGNLAGASVAAGGHLNVSGTYTNNLVLPVNGGTLTLDGDWFNAGELWLTNATFNLDGTFGLAALGTIVRVGGSVRVTGLLEGAGGTLALDDTTGSWLMNGGTLRRVIVSASGSALLQGASGMLDGVTLDSNFDVLSGTLTVTNGLVLNGVARVGHPSSGAVGTLLFHGSQALSGSGSVLLGNSGCNLLRISINGTTLTNRALIHGHSGQIGWSTCSGGAATSSLVNEGTLSADTSGGTVIVRATPFINNGTTNSMNGGVLRINP